MLYLVVFFSNVCDIYVCYMLNKITYLLMHDAYVGGRSKINIKLFKSVPPCLQTF